MGRTSSRWGKSKKERQECKKKSKAKGVCLRPKKAYHEFINDVGGKNKTQVQIRSRNKPLCFRQHVFEGDFNSSTDLLPGVRGTVYSVLCCVKLTVSMFADVGSGHRDRDRCRGLLHAVDDSPAAVGGTRNPPLLLRYLLVLLVALLALMVLLLVTMLALVALMVLLVMLH